MNIPYLPVIKKFDQIEPQEDIPVYQIDLQYDNVLNLKLYSNNKANTEFSGKLQHMHNIIEMVSCYIAEGTNIFELDSQKISLQHMFYFAGEFVWSYFHYNEQTRNLWKEFVRQANRCSLKAGIILATGAAAIVTSPIEYISNKEKELEIAVAKKGLLTSMEVLYRKLPRKVLLVLGVENGEEKLDHKTELRLIHQLLCPNGEEPNYDEYIYRGGVIKSRGISGNYEVEIIGSYDTLDTVTGKIRDIHEPYILLYSGHGVYRDSKFPAGYFDGELNIRSKDKDKRTASHAEICKAIEINPPFGIIFNCCNGVRKMQFTENSRGETGEQCDDVLENHYLKFRANTRFIMAFKSKIRDTFAMQITRALMDSITEHKNIIEFLIKARKYTAEETNFPEGFNTNKSIDRLIRDRSSMVFWLL